jgi:hypothetical protein
MYLWINEKVKVWALFSSNQLMLPVAGIKKIEKGALEK